MAEVRVVRLEDSFPGSRSCDWRVALGESRASVVADGWPMVVIQRPVKGGREWFEPLGAFSSLALAEQFAAGCCVPFSGERAFIVVCEDEADGDEAEAGPVVADDEARAYGPSGAPPSQRDEYR